MTSHGSDATRAPARTLLVGFGKLGALLAPRLRADGGEVIALRRSDGALPDGVTGIRADLSAPALEPLPQVDAMVVTLPPSGPSGYRTALTRLAAALPAVPARTVFVSSTGVFEGRGAEHAITEQDDPAPTSERAQELRDGERTAIDLFGAVILRPAGIYGPGRDFLIRQVREHATVNHRRRTNRIHDADLVRTIDLLLRMPEPPRVLHAVDAAPAPLGDVVGFIARTLGVEVPPDDVSAAATGTVLDGAVLRAVLGELEYPTYEEGYAAMLTSPPRSTPA